MKVNCRIRLSKNDMARFKNFAASRDIPVSVALREAAYPFIDGVKTLPQMPEPGLEATSCTIEYSDIEALKQMAGDANLAFDDAMRIIVSQYLEAQENSNTNNK